MFTRTSITLSRSAFDANINMINAFTGYDQLALVVKSNAYGHGMQQMAQLGQEHQGVGVICVVGIEEALYLKKQGIAKPILVLSFLDGNIDEAIYHDIQLSVSSYNEALAIAAAAERVGKKARIHCKIDTGMGRMGFCVEHAVKELHAVAQLPALELYGIRTHLSDTGHADTSYSKKQLELFDQVLDEAASLGIYFRYTHALSSSSLGLKTKRSYSYMRIGAAAFGLWKSEEQRSLLTKIQPEFALQPVLEWRARIVQLRKVPAGSYIGYKRTYKTKKESVIAIVPVGYWDGYPYTLANKGYALIHHRYVPVVGIISMNITAFDVTAVPQVQEGDELILCSNAPLIAPHELAQCAGIITNEMTTRIHPAISREVVAYHQPIVIGDDRIVENQYRK